MAETPTQEFLVDELAEDFARRLRLGERPSVEEYAQRHPLWAEEIRTVLSAVVMMEQLKPSPQDAVATSEAPASDRPPERLGEYRILREIGRGGMGVVYEAEQEALGRRVAIKVLPGHLLVKLRSRFRREAQAAARLHHTNIVPVFGVGEAQGYCFYVMQLIQGCGLDQLIREAGAAGGVWPVNTPSTQTVAEGTIAPAAAGDRAAQVRVPVSLSMRDSYRMVAKIGAEVADALAHAHQQGVLHRDIKPSNLLLDDRGTVWVTDFGLAKLVEEAHLTQSGDLVGTLKYMPPERFAGLSEARGDIYSLGVTLYELLSLQSAFPDTNAQHLIQLITQDAPIPLRKLKPQIPTDLETIVHKAAARDPAHRYQSPGELAEDLRRFLEDRPILARRTGPLQLAWRWCRRNPALALATAAVFLLMVAITAVSVAAYAQTAAANRETANALESEKIQRAGAEQTSTLALDALNRIFDRFAPTRLVVTPEESTEAGVELPPQPTLPPEAVPLLEDLLRTYEQLARAGEEFPRLQAQSAEANYRIGEICQRLGRLERAVAAYRGAVELYALQVDEVAGSAPRIKLARAYNELGRTLHTLQQPDEARQMHGRAIQTLAALPQQLAKRPEVRYELARSYYILGQRDMLYSGGPGKGPPRPRDDPDRGPPERGRRGPPDRSGNRRPETRGDPGAPQAVTLLEALVSEFPNVPEYRHLLACCYRDLPPERFGRGQASRPDRAVDLMRQLVKDFPNVPDFRLDLCETLGRPGPPGRHNELDGPKRQERLKEAIKLSGQLMKQYPNVPEYAAAHARNLDGLGLNYFREKNYPDSQRCHQQAVDIQERLVSRYPQVVAYGFWLGLMERSLGQALSEQGQLKQARRRLEAATGRIESLLKNDARLKGARPFLGRAYRDLAETLTRGGDTQAAAQARRKAEGLDGRPPGGDRFRPRERGRP